MSWQPVPCPVCGCTGYHEGRMCPKQSGDGVCIICCKACECYKHGRMNPCGYYLIYPRVNVEEEIRKLNNRIEYLREKVRYYYRRNWIQAALKMEKDIEELLRQRRCMEGKVKNEKNERNNQNSGTGGFRADGNAVLYGSGRDGNSGRHNGLAGGNN